MTFTAMQIENHQLINLLRAAGDSEDIISINNCAGGGNNRVFSIKTSSNQYIAKWYFSHPSDTRDRLNAEYSLLKYAHRLGLKCIPAPLASLPNEQIALYEFIEGSKLESGQLSAQHVDEAAKFFLALNSADRFRLADAIPKASEACFSIDEQIASVRIRVTRLTSISPLTPEDSSAVKFAHQVQAKLNEVVDQITISAAQAGLNTDEILPIDQRGISPSDFGFHNALIPPTGNLCFLDFEYAGWDDPAKMVCDFFCQPAVPVSPKHFKKFVSQILNVATDSKSLTMRINLLFPLFQIKWCCIMLNEFFPDSARRRQFAKPMVDLATQKRDQLKKATTLLNQTPLKC